MRVGGSIPGSANWRPAVSLGRTLKPNIAPVAQDKKRVNDQVIDGRIQFLGSVV